MNPAMIAQMVPVVVVTHAGPTERTQRCLASLAATEQAAPVVVVDNSGGPHCESGAYGPGIVHVVRTPNRGYGAAANIGFDTVRRLAPEASAVALLNDDIEVEPGWLGPLVDALAGGADVAQPKLLQAPRSSQPSVNSVGVQLDSSGAGADIGYGEPDSDAFELGSDIVIFTGGAIVLTRDFLDATGGFDERYFLYYEDVDLALRGGELGRRYRCEPASIVWHEGGATTADLGVERRRLQERNRLWCALRFLPAAGIARAFWLSIRRLRHTPRGVHARALIGGLGGAPALLIARFKARRMIEMAA
jgi:N-acetylglucosaminyl-diphospho-decaprenol L-rhamnosyltransferase